MDSTSTGPLRPGTSCGCIKITVRIYSTLKRMSSMFIRCRRNMYMVSDKNPLVEIYDQGALINVG